MEEFLVKKIIKKVTATTLSAAGILFAVPSAFCSGNEPGSLNLAAEGAGRPQGRNLRAFHMLTVGKYLNITLLNMILNCSLMRKLCTLNVTKENSKQHSLIKKLKDWFIFLDLLVVINFGRS